MGLAVAMTAAGWAQAQSSLPSSVRQQGEQQERRQQEQGAAQRSRLQPSVVSPLSASPEPLKPWPAGESPCQPIRAVALAGPESSSFAWVLDDLLTGPGAAVGRCLGVEGLNVAADRAQHALLERGYVTSRVALPVQDLSGGTLTLTVLPGRIRAIRLAEPREPRANLVHAVPARPGDILNLRDIEQALENLRRVPTVQADIQIEPADAPDQSDLVIRWQQAFPVRLALSLDDAGTQATGKYQGSLTLSYDHWWTLNDLFYLTVNGDLGGGGAGPRGSRGHAVHYSLPWGNWQLALNHSANRYHQRVAGLSQDYVYSGRSENADVRLSRLIHRDAQGKTMASVKAWMRRSSNAIDDTEVQTQRRATGGWELGLAHKAFVGRATLDATLAHKRGTGAFHATPAPEEPFGEGTSRMQVTTADVSLNAPLAAAGQKLRYAASWRAQWNGTALTPPDRFAIGGRYTVRGFDGESSLAAERGWLVRNDLALALGDSGQEAYLGLDYGQVRGPSSELLVGRHLAGAALGLRGSVGKLGYDVFVGRPVSRPEAFRTAAVTAGFSFFASF
jgi:hemolysin activation/secretion protein